MVATKGQMKERKNSGGVNDSLNSLKGHYHIFKDLESSDERLLPQAPGLRWVVTRAGAWSRNIT